MDRAAILLRGVVNPDHPWCVNHVNGRTGGALDEIEVRRLIQEAYPKLVAGLTLVCGSRAAAEDAAQEALARWWERSSRGQTIETPEAWMTAVALNLARSRLRRLRAERRARDRLQPSSIPEPAPEVVDLRRALAQLPTREREAVVLHYYMDLSVAEVAAIQGVSDGTVKTSLHRARRRLAQTLAEHDISTEEADHGRR
jgi:RNA polymerase sigma-70 factor (ECF subfamily)